MYIVLMFIIFGMKKQAFLDKWKDFDKSERKLKTFTCLNLVADAC